MDDAIPVTIRYDDLISFPSGTHNDNNTTHNTYTDSDSFLITQIGRAFGPTGLGVVLIEGVPELTGMRHALLPLAARIPTLPDLNETCVNPLSLYSVGWSHGKEELIPGQPDTTKGSYYANPLTNDRRRRQRTDDENTNNNHKDNDPISATTGATILPVHEPREVKQQLEQMMTLPNVWPSLSLPELEPAFASLGQLLYHVGCHLANVCDAYCRSNHHQQQSVPTRIAPTLQQSLNVTGRLLHYFPAVHVDHDIPPILSTVVDDDSISITPPPQPPSHQHQWCGWHKDHSALTGLVSGLYMNEALEIVPCPSHNDDDTRQSSGLFVQTRTKELIRIVIPPDQCAFQVGETCQILSGGLLQATPHAVLTASAAATKQSSESDNTVQPLAPRSLVTRESFAVFLAPEYDDPLDIPVGCSIHDCQGIVDETLGLRSLNDRWRPGMTYGEFHTSTTAAFVIREK